MIFILNQMVGWWRVVATSTIIAVTLEGFYTGTPSENKSVDFKKVRFHILVR